MMTAEQLKASILQLAMEGKLVEQRPEEGTGEGLFHQIQAEKSKLVKEGKIKKQKPLRAIDEDEKPFDIPESWRWVRFGEIVSFRMGKTPPREDLSFWKRDIPWVSIADMIDGGVVVKTKEGISQGAFEKKFGSLISPKGTLIMSFKLSVGKVSILGEDCVHNEAIISIFPFIDFNNSFRDYLFHMLPELSQYGHANKAVKGFTLNNSSISNMLVPLPPLQEQFRIVQKLELLAPFVKQYKSVSEKLDKLNVDFPDQMTKSILQMAVEGKLVEQRPEEGTGEELFRKIQEEKAKLIKEGKIKKQKPLAEITDDEKPFDIPDSWTWIRLKDLGEFSSGKTPSMSDVRNWQNGRVSWITSKDMKNKYLSISQMLISEYAASEMRLYPPNTMLMVVRSGILKRMLPVSILTANSTINQDIKAFSLYYPDICEYIYVVLKGMETYILQTYRKQVTTVDSLRFEDFQNMPIPIPPEQEQRRIILKLNTILPEIEQLNK
ncbi:MAG TPA: hypothetical protein DEV97_07280 [Lachnospiraceae bacterium]|nr:hypothetical protein [Lachnospiraceae bacterium]